MRHKQSSTELVTNTLSARSEATVAELASATGLGRSTVGKALIKLERLGEAHRVAGGRKGATRRPDRWRRPGKHESSSKSPKPAVRPRGQKAERLRPGQLDELVIAYVNEHAGEALGPAVVAKELGRSSGAVANCLARLAKAGHVREVGKRPRRYRVVRNSRRP